MHGANAAADALFFEGFRLDPDGLFRIEQSGLTTPLALGGRALDVLRLLVIRPGDLVSKGTIMDAVWAGVVGEEANLTVQMSALRRILDQNRKQGSCIQTIPGRGYRFVAPVSTADPSLTARDSLDTGDSPTVAGRQLHAQHLTDDTWPARVRNSLQQPWSLAALALAGALLIYAVLIASSWRLAPVATTREAPPAAPAAAPRLSIVVLPFNNLSNDPEQQYFADGVTEDLTTDLSRIAGSFVISRNTAFTYKGKPVNAKQIGRELGVRYVLEGSVQRSAKQVRVNAQLIDAETGAHLWAERFERDIGDLFALQNEVAGRIAVALNYALVGAEAARPTANPDALDYIFRARAAASKPPSRDKYAESISLFERALALDSGAVEAQSILAIQLTGRVLDGMTDTAAADMARAENLSGQAMAASPGSPFAHLARGNVLRAQRRYAEAIPEYEAVLASNRNSVSALRALGQCKLFVGSIEETIPLLEQAIRLSPRDPYLGNWYSDIGRVHLLQSRTDDAIVWSEKARSANPAHPGNRAYLASAYGLKGESERAAAELAEARRLSVNPDAAFSSIARLRAASNFMAPNIRALRETTYYVGLRKAGVPEE